jgi:hypothetical protein
VLVLAVSFASACRTLLSGGKPQETAPARPAAEPKIAEVCEAADRGDYLGALELIEGELRQGQPESRFSEPYVQSINGLLEQAEREYLNRDPRAAGILFRETLDHYPRSNAVRREIAMGVTEVQAALDVCADDLLALGMTAYRAGRLERAITIWTAIEEFHPDHEQSQQAIETTRVQLRNLRELTERGARE